ncbi:transcription factor AP-1 [Oopsacas minuta]|uniref:Transcription factor AP-1 n=1 Tax=Oopsacas minuta TaxID=111878 RepID=A0A0U2GU52_9METZ|nr:transcription factor AP-1 [Oopsacas minuta]KAI6656917.1 transcription factor AP-1 [Oopsacas minuta]
METNANVDVVKSELHNTKAALSIVPNGGGEFQNNNSNTEYITKEQESYAKGFDEALQSIHFKEQFQLSDPTNAAPSLQNDYFSSDFFKQNSTTPNFDNLQTLFQGAKNSIARSKSYGYISPYGEDMNSQDPLSIYPNYDPIPNFPPFHFITDMEEQEHLKRERKRIRNRLAASKCRKKRLEREARLEENVKSIEDDFLELKNRKLILEKEVLELKNTIQSHSQEGCNV